MTCPYERIRRSFPLLAVLPSILLAATIAAAAGPPRQALIELSMPPEPSESRLASNTLEGGEARVTVVAKNHAGRTTGVTLRFRYTLEPGTIALDEIIDRIVIETIDESGNVIGRVTIVPNEVNLNPGGPRLSYRATLYRPEDMPYTVRTRIFGNYE